MRKVAFQKMKMILCIRYLYLRTRNTIPFGAIFNWFLYTALNHGALVSRKKNTLETRMWFNGGLLKISWAVRKKNQQ
jgi:hypothetical protein